MLERQKSRFFNQRGELVAVAKPAAFRVERHAAREKGKYGNMELPHPWTEQELQGIEQDILNEKIRGSHTRFREDVEVGEKLPAMVRGPLGIH